MTKQEIVTTVYEKLGFSKRESSDIVENFFKIVKEKLVHGRKCQDLGARELCRQGKEGEEGKKPADRRRDRDCAAQSAQLQAEPGPKGRDKQQH